jgi:hypothetical protein
LVTQEVVPTNSSGHIFVGTSENGIYISTDNGNTWTNHSSGLTDLSIGVVAVLSNGYAFAAGNDTRLYRSVLPTVSVRVKDNNTPTAFLLEQNYPNPFNPSTTIEYSIPERMMVQIHVFDILGRKISTLINEVKEAGNYKIEFSAEGGYTSGGNTGYLPSGIYFYRIKTDKFIQTKKFLLLK